MTASPGARAYYDAMRAWNIGHHAALRQLADRLVGVLHGCLKTMTKYAEDTACGPTNRPCRADRGLTRLSMGCLTPGRAGVASQHSSGRSFRVCEERSR